MTNKQPEALRLAEHLEQFRSFPDDLAAAKELRRQHARIVELEAEKVRKDRERRADVAEALGIGNGNANFAWSYLHSQIKYLVECEEELIALRKQAAAQQAVQDVRLPLSDEFPQGFLSDVLTAAGLVSHGKQCKALGLRIGEAVEAIRKISIQQREAISTHGITQKSRDDN